MNGWITFWGGLLFAAMAVFAIMTVVVAVGGYKDLRRMFKLLEDKGGPKTTPPDASHDQVD